jgi:predicted lipoprotein with Yx(FWY)xxD motif
VRKIAACLFASALVLAACGGDDDDTSSGGTPTSEAESAGAATGAGIGALIGEGETDLGPVLTDAEGLTLYAFTNDTDGTSTCEGGCAEAWPPVAVDGAELPEGLDADVFSVVERSDGTYQLAANGAPLYTYASDAAPGDTTGQGSGGVWYVVTPDGDLNQSTAPAGGGATTVPADDADTGAGDDPY